MPVRTSLRHEGGTRLNVLLGAVQVPREVGGNKHHCHIRTHRADLFHLELVLAALVDVIENGRAAALNRLAPLKVPTQYVNKVGISANSAVQVALS